MPPLSPAYSQFCHYQSRSVGGICRASFQKRYGGIVGFYHYRVLSKNVEVHYSACQVFGVRRCENQADGKV